MTSGADAVLPRAGIHGRGPGAGGPVPCCGSEAEVAPVDGSPRPSGQDDVASSRSFGPTGEDGPRPGLAPYEAAAAVRDGRTRAGDRSAAAVGSSVPARLKDGEPTAVAVPATLHVVDGDHSEREALVALLSAAGYATRAYPSAAALLAFGAAEDGGDAPGPGPSGPSAVVADMQVLGGADGLALLQRPRVSDGLQVRLPVVLVTAHATVQQAVHAMKAGAVDFLEKPLDASALFAAVESALDRFRSDEAELAARAGARRRLQALLPRERDVLERLLVLGGSKAIASDLGLSPRTVELYRARIMAKTKAAGLPELARLAIEAGMWGAASPLPASSPAETRQTLDADSRPQEGLQEFSIFSMR